MIVEVQELLKKYPSFELSKASFGLESGRIAGFIGRNGAGKTTLLNLISRRLMPDEGEVILTKDADLGYLMQHQGLQSDACLYDEIASARSDLFLLEEQLRQTEKDMEAASEEKLSQLMQQYSLLSHRFEEEGGLLIVTLQAQEEENRLVFSREGGEK